MKTVAFGRPTSDSYGASKLVFGGADRDRTGDPLLAKQVLSQLSYSPPLDMVGLDRLELSTSPLSGVRSSHLSYRPGATPQNEFEDRVERADRLRRSGPSCGNAREERVQARLPSRTSGKKFRMGYIATSLAYLSKPLAAGDQHLASSSAAKKLSS